MATLLNLKVTTSNFFDRSAVINAMDKKTRDRLSRFGAYVRQSDISSQRTRKAISEVGSPPSAHVGAIKRLTYFAYDSAAKSVVIGPVPFGDNAASIIEAGGTRSGKLFGGPTVIMRYRARPHTGPAFKKELALEPTRTWKE
jgi:hypothetical protein